MSNIKVVVFEKNSSENINYIGRCDGNDNVKSSLKELLKVYNRFNMISVSIYAIENNIKVTYIFQGRKEEIKNYIAKILHIFDSAKIYVRKHGYIRVMYYFNDKK